MPAQERRVESQPLLRGDNETSYQATSVGEHEGVQQPAAKDDRPRVTVPHFRWTVSALWCIVFLGAMDGTITATMITPVGSYFHKSNEASYIGTAYLLSVCCFTPLYGRLADILGRRGALLLALTLFGVGTVLCGLAPSLELLIAARVLAGMGGGGVMTVSNITMTDLVSLKERGLYQGATNILFGLGAGLGGPLGGFLNDQLGWRSAFLLQGPALILAFVMIFFHVRIPLSDDVKNTPLSVKIRRIDFFGSLTLVIAVASLLLAFSLRASEEMAWTHPIIIGLFAASAVSSVAFALVEVYWATHPVLPLALITKRTPLAVGVANFFSSMSSFSMMYNVPLYFQAVKLTSATEAGLHLLPNAVCIGLGSLLAGWWIRRTGKYYRLTLFSASAVVIGSLLLIGWNENTSAFEYYADIVPMSTGYTSFLTTSLIAIIASVDKEDIAVATGTTYLFRTTGQVLGVSASAVVLQAVLVAKLRARITDSNSAEIINSIRHSTEIIPTLKPYLRDAAVRSYADALRVVFIGQSVISFLCLIACTFFEEHALP